MTQKNNQLITTIVIAAISLTIGFLGGTQYQKSKPSQFGNFRQSVEAKNRQLPGAPVANNGGQRLAVNRPVSGEITQIDQNLITVKLADGGSQNIVFSDSTKINQMTEISLSDLKIGETINVLESEASSNVLTAKTILVGDGLFQRQNPSIDQ